MGVTVYLLLFVEGAAHSFVSHTSNFVSKPYCGKKKNMDSVRGEECRHLRRTGAHVCSSVRLFIDQKMFPANQMKGAVKGSHGFLVPEKYVPCHGRSSGEISVLMMRCTKEPENGKAIRMFMFQGSSCGSLLGV